jgi:sugar/nucleoside kinase (ribokinase family)
VYIKVNLSEALFSLNSNVDMSDTIRNNEEIKQVARETAIKLWQRTKRPVFITLGENGITSYDGISYSEIPAYKVEGPIDIVGAGDSVLAGIGLALCVGATPAEAAFIGNLVGSITVQQIGTTGTANMEDLINRYKQYKQQ